jgi:RimJ/RimL family protein N-acetyltransferase
LFSHFQSSSDGLKAGFLTSRDRAAVLEYLHRNPQLNLQLLDLIDHPKPAQGVFRGIDSEPIVLVAWEADQVEGVAALRPTLLFDAHLEPPALRAFLPFLTTIETGLLKSLDPVVTRLWDLLEERGSRSLIDRYEIAFAIRPGEESLTLIREDVILRSAREQDLEELVYAARASLREEGRPDPGERDPAGFERWVKSRIERARVVEYRGRLAFVAYADVRRPEGWLIQGVFTWPEFRRRGLAAAGMSGLVREAFAGGADHLQLAVVEGNKPALGLYRGLGFRAFGRLRTVLFVRPSGSDPV